VYDGNAGQIGGYWTRTKPSGPVQSIIDSALNPQWGNTATSVATIRVPAGTTIYEVPLPQRRSCLQWKPGVHPECEPSGLVP